MVRPLARFVAAALVVSALAGPSAFAQQAPVDDVAARIWDLSLYYRDDDAWERERRWLEQRAAGITELRGRLGTSAAALADALDAIADLRSRAAKIALYGFALEAADTRSEAARQRAEVGATLELKVESAVSFVPHEVAALGKTRLRAWLAAEPRLARHRPRIERILFAAPHTLNAESQAILESAVRWPTGFQDLHAELLEADLGWSRIELPGQAAVAADLDAFLAHRRSAERSIRDPIVGAFLERLAALEAPLGLLATRRVEADRTLARHRGFDDGIAALWYLRDGMPVGSHRELPAALVRLRPIAQRYARTKARALGLAAPGYFDLLTNPPALDHRYSVARSAALAREALAPLGDELARGLPGLLDRPWFHLPMTPGKRRVYANWVSMAGSPPLSIQPYESNFASARRMAGALLWMSAQLAIPPGRAPETRDDPPTIGNGALYVANLLFDDHYRARHAANDAERRALLVSSLDHLRVNFFDVALLSALDDWIERRVAAGAPPSGREISAEQLRLLRELFGGEGGVAIEERDGRIWMAESVPFLSYEHQFWAAAMASACDLVERIRRGEEPARRAVVDSTWDPQLYLSYPMLRRAGVDLATPAPYDAVGRRATALLDELDRLLLRQP